jgi:hypothetical protein
MYDPKFENTVKQKMEELEFRPAESVWANIEKAVADKRRRRAVILWRFLLPGMVLVAAAGVYTFEGKKTAGNGPAVASVAEPSARPKGAGAGSAGVVTRASQATGAVMKAGQAKAAGTGTAGEGAGPTSRPGGGTKDAVAANKSIEEQYNQENDGAAGNIGESLVNSRPSPNKAQPIQGLPVWLYQPGLANQHLGPMIQAKALTIKKAGTTSIVVPAKKRPWEAGFVAGAGISKLNRLNSENAAAAVSYQAMSFYSINGSSSGKHSVSDIRPDASWFGGIYLQKPLSSRLIFNTGMNLHYYSTRLTVGEQVKTYVNPSVSLLVPTIAPAAISATLYSAGDVQTVTNRYYFLEVPVGLQWKLNKSSMLPLFVEGGLSLSRLMSSNGLFYDEKNGVYTKDASAMNKTQLDVSSALMVGLPFHGIRMQVGPQVQYGLTPLVNNQSLGDQHFFYTGIRLVVLPGRR